MNKNITMAVLLALALAVLVGGWFFMQKREVLMDRDSDDSVSTVTSTPVVVESTDSGSAGDRVVSEAVKSFDVEAGNYFYDPKEIRVKRGDTVEITLTAKDMMHNFNIDEFGVKSPTVKAGDSAVFEFVADRLGTFEYYCSIGEHRKLGQVGKLIVE